MFLINPYIHGEPSGGNDAYTMLLLNCDGSDESTTFTDTSVGGSTHTVSANGNAQIDTTYKRWGTGGALFDGDYDYLSVPDHADFIFGNGNFAIDFWVRATSPGQTNSSVIVAKFNTASNDTPFSINLQNGTYDLTFSLGSTVSEDLVASAAIGTLTSGVWSHVAIVRSGSNAYGYLGGVRGSSSSVGTSSLLANGESLLFGSGNFATTHFAGLMDEIRVSKGSDRGWTGSTITVPAAAYTI